VAVGDALAVAVVLLEAVAVVVEGALDASRTQRQGEILDAAGQPLGQYPSR
jgi:hypothetical protein